MNVEKNSGAKDKMPDEREMYSITVIPENLSEGKHFYFVTPNHNQTWQELLLDIAQSQNLKVSV